MMLISTRMLLHSLAILADKWESGVRMNCKDIEKKCGLQERTISVNLTKLAKVGILDSITGGSMRGYKFARDPREVSIAEVIEVVEGPTEFHCGKDVINGIICNNDPKTCKVYGIYADLYRVTNEKLYNLSIQDFADACHGEL